MLTIGREQWPPCRLGKTAIVAGKLSNYRKEALEELAVLRQRDAQIFGGGLLTACPLLLEPCLGCRETAGELIDDVGDKAVGLVRAFSGIVDETRLDVVPPRAEAGEFIGGEEVSVGCRLGPLGGPVGPPSRCPVGGVLGGQRGRCHGHLVELPVGRLRCLGLELPVPVRCPGSPAGAARSPTRPHHGARLPNLPLPLRNSGPRFGVVQHFAFLGRLASFGVLIVCGHARASSDLSSRFRAIYRTARGSGRTPDVAARCRHRPAAVTGGCGVRRGSCRRPSGGRRRCRPPVVRNRRPDSRVAHHLGDEQIGVANRARRIVDEAVCPSASDTRRSRAPQGSTGQCRACRGLLAGSKLIFRCLLFADIVDGALVLGTEPVLQSLRPFAAVRGFCDDDRNTVATTVTTIRIHPQVGISLVLLSCQAEYPGGATGNVNFFWTDSRRPIKLIDKAFRPPPGLPTCGAGERGHRRRRLTSRAGKAVSSRCACRRPRVPPNPGPPGSRR